MLVKSIRPFLTELLSAKTYFYLWFIHENNMTYNIIMTQRNTEPMRH